MNKLTLEQAIDLSVLQAVTGFTMTRAITLLTKHRGENWPESIKPLKEAVCTSVAKQLPSAS